MTPLLRARIAEDAFHRTLVSQSPWALVVARATGTHRPDGLRFCTTIAASATPTPPTASFPETARSSP